MGCTPNGDCMCVCVFMYNAGTWNSEDSLWFYFFRHLLLFIWNKVFHWPGTSPSRSGEPTICLRLPSHRYRDAKCAWLLTQILGLELTSFICESSISWAVLSATLCCGLSWLTLWLFNGRVRTFWPLGGYGQTPTSSHVIGSQSSAADILRLWCLCLLLVHVSWPGHHPTCTGWRTSVGCFADIRASEKKLLSLSSWGVSHWTGFLLGAQGWQSLRLPVLLYLTQNFLWLFYVQF